MVVEVEFYERDTQRFRAVRLSVIDAGEASVLAALRKDGQKVSKLMKIKVVDPPSKSPEPIPSSQQPPTQAPTESSDDSKGNLSLFQPLGL